MTPQVNGLALPVDPSRYPAFFRAPIWRPWRSIVGFIATLAACLALMTLIPVVAVIVDLVSGRLTTDDLLSTTMDNLAIMTPNFFLFNNLGIAAAIPTCLTLAWIIFKQRPGWLHSVAGRFRWRWLALLVVSFLPFWVVGMVIEIIAQGGLGAFALSISDDTAFLIAAVLLTTPLQSAGEEYFCRGMLNRSVASLVSDPKVGVGLGAIVSSVVFMALHVSTDLWLNIFYFSFGMAACWMTWRTGGLEAAVAVHAVNNVVSMWVLPFGDFRELFARSSGSSSPASIAVSLLMLACAVGVVEFWMRRKPVENTAAPGLAALPAPPVHWAPPTFPPPGEPSTHWPPPTQVVNTP